MAHHDMNQFLAPDDRHEGPWEVELPLAWETCTALYDPHNRRIKVFGVTAAQFQASTSCLALLSESRATPGFSKLIVYSFPGEESTWRDLGLTHEGCIVGFFPGSTDAHLWVCYLHPGRGRNDLGAKHDEIVALARSKQPREPSLPAGYTCEVAGEADAPVVAELLDETFRDYPSPLDLQRVTSLIQSGASHFRLVRDASGHLLAVASAEIDRRNGNAELTDCASRPEARGQGLMAYLLAALERDMVEKMNLTDLYTLARADEVGINCAFARVGYTYTGRLINNCRMPNGWESVNIWCKQAHQAASDLEGMT